MIDDQRPDARGRHAHNAAGAAVIWAVLATFAALAVSVFDPALLEGVIVVWALVVGLIALAYVAAIMLRHIPLQELPRRRLELPRLRRYHPERQAAPGLREMERMVIFGQASAYDFESRLRPHLTAIAEQRLAAHGLTLNSSPDRVSALLGPDAWELVRPDYRPLGDRRRYGVPWARLERAVEGLDV
ncbi:MAG: hypothetical protein J2P38_09540, partial [Candidatus Dormibacteraeota bacterium]|nr:hypothetical protein [Candidatus Dormibacteraeota bacterium]